MSDVAQTETLFSRATFNSQRLEEQSRWLFTPKSSREDVVDATKAVVASTANQPHTSLASTPPSIESNPAGTRRGVSAVTTTEDSIGSPSAVSLPRPPTAPSSSKEYIDDTTNNSIVRERVGLIPEGERTTSRVAYRLSTISLPAPTSLILLDDRVSCPTGLQDFTTLHAICGIHRFRNYRMIHPVSAASLLAQV
ncbi:hypothetical protein CPC08DRAFT_767740 [Agrocybe pediades]|nr:hypothetical protein CPC08DRAFT_767740 [Agrocybe pediades]